MFSSHPEQRLDSDGSTGGIQAVKNVHLAESSDRRAEKAQIEKDRQIARAEVLDVLGVTNVELHAFAMVGLQHLEIYVKLCGMYFKEEGTRPVDLLKRFWPRIRTYAGMTQMDDRTAGRVLSILEEYVSRPEYILEVFDRIIEDPVELAEYWNGRIGMTYKAIALKQKKAA
jgi:hypothetical protein